MNTIYEALLIQAQANSKKPIEDIDEIIDVARQIKANALHFYQSGKLTESEYNAIVTALTNSNGNAR